MTPAPRPALTPVQEAIVNRFLSELETWQAEHPGWTEADQLSAFSPYSLWRRAGGRSAVDGQPAKADQAVYLRLVEIAGYREGGR